MDSKEFDQLLDHVCEQLDRISQQLDSDDLPIVDPSVIAPIANSSPTQAPKIKKTPLF